MRWFIGAVLGLLAERGPQGQPAPNQDAPQRGPADDGRNWAEGAKSLDERQLQALLREYETSSAFCNQIGTATWSLMAAVPAAALAGIGAIVLNLDRLRYPSASLALIAIGMMLYYWYRAQERWRDFLIAHNYRRQEIEDEIGLFANRYTDWLDEIAKPDSDYRAQWLANHKDNPNLKRLVARLARKPGDDPGPEGCWRHALESVDRLPDPMWGHRSRRLTILVVLAVTILVLLALSLVVLLMTVA